MVDIANYRSKIKSSRSSKETLYGVVQSRYISPQISGVPGYVLLTLFENAHN